MAQSIYNVRKELNELEAIATPTEAQKARTGLLICILEDHEAEMKEWATEDRFTYEDERD